MAEEKSPLTKKEEEILEFWQANKIFEQTLNKPSPRGDFVFYEGPPTANGRPGIHHIEARAFKDLIPRFKTMQGYQVRRKAGWDTHGLPVELEVEKELGLKSKKEVEHYGATTFNQKCRTNVWKYLAEWQKFTERIGYWVDQQNPYITYTPNYMESVWWVIKQAQDQGLLYKDYKVLPWCPRCGTALSSHELAQGYKEVKDPAVFVKFKVKPGQKIGDWVSTDKTYFVAWTTTPWTLPGNVALAVGEKIEYFLFQNGDEYLIATRESKFFAPSDSSGMASREEIQIPASQLIGLEYESLFPYLKDNLPPSEQAKLVNAFKVYSADFVTTGEGTGIVHTAVMYGVDDFELGTKVGLPKFHLVNPAGEFIAGVGEFSGRSVMETNVDIIIDLKQRGLLLKKETVTHTYPFCWRCQTPLIYYARDSWYIRMSALREKLLEANRGINWIPAHIKDGRFGEWLAEVKDWAISRERYWGTPLPVWAGDNQKLVIGSIEELKKYTKKSGNKYFVMRHGEADNNVASRVSSKFDNPDHLTAVGRVGVLEASKLLKAEKIDLIISSDFVRTKETAEISAEVLGLAKKQIEYDIRLREVNHGDLNGQPTQVYYDYFKTREEYFTNRLPNGESLMEVKRRMGELLYDLEVKYQNKKILIITHESPSWLLFAVASGADLTQTLTLRGDTADFLKNAEVRKLDFIPLPHNADYELDLHRPFIDEVELISETGTILKRTSEVLDVWFDSGAMPWAQDHQPFSGQKLLYPADFIAEAIDQTRGWFYTLLALGVLLGKGSPYQNVICLGHILDPEGKKMSKSIGNVVDPWLMMDKYGVDALRFWMYTVNAPGESKNFDETSVVEVVRKVINPLMNVLAFYKLYRDEVGALSEVSNSEQVLDRWLVALQADLAQRVTKHLEEYQITEASRLLRDFVADLSQWYLRRSRDRIRGTDSADRVAALGTLKQSLQQFAQLLAPFMPFLAEDIYRELHQATDPISIHLTDWPEVENKKSEKLLQNMKIVRKIASLGLEARARAGVKVRQPLQTLFVQGLKPDDLTDDFLILIKDEVNVKAVLWQNDLPEPVKLDLTITPVLRAEGQIRDFIHQVQDLRKESGLAPSDQIILFVTVPPADQATLESARAEIRRVVSATEICFSPGETIEIRLERV
jgi:isoleucyl-tRNA synthetase